MRARWSGLVVWAIAVGMACVALQRLVPICRDQLAAPFDLISEGPHMSTIKAIWSGFDIYARTSFLDLPFHMTPYTPLYHALVAALPQDPANPFVTGRLVAAAFMVLAALTLPVVARAGHRAVAVIALAVFFLLHPVTGNTVYLRSDSMALCASLWGVVTLARARGRRGVVASAVLCAIAVAAKQSFLAAGLTCVVAVALAHRRDLPAFLAAGMGVGLLLALAATLAFGWDFWFAVTIPASDYPRDLESFWWHWEMLLAQPLVRFLIGAALVATAAAVVKNGWRALAAAPFFYMLLAWALQTSVMTGIGAENHNLIEPMLATLVWIVIALQLGRPRLELGLAWAAGLAVLIFCTRLELGDTDTSHYSFTNPAKTARYVHERANAQAALRERGLEHGRLLNLKNSQIPHDFPENAIVLNDLWMYITVLWSSRPETVDRLVDAIEHEVFDVVVVSPGVARPDPSPNDSPWRRVSHALFAHYGLAYHGGEVNLLTRSRAPTPSGS